MLFAQTLWILITRDDICMNFIIFKMRPPKLRPLFELRSFTYINKRHFKFLKEDMVKAQALTPNPTTSMVIVSHSSIQSKPLDHNGDVISLMHLFYDT
jgi:hypothetical protein